MVEQRKNGGKDGAEAISERPEHDPAACPYAPKPRTPRLVWCGMEDRQAVEAAPTQVVEIVTPGLAEQQVGMGLEVRETPAVYGIPEERPNRLIWCNDNLVALQTLIAEGYEGKVDLIYIDPPFAAGRDFNLPLMQVEIEGDAVDVKAPGLIEELAFSDTWGRGLDSYLSMMRDRLLLLRRLLASSGALFLQCDYHAGHYLKVLLDGVFGYENFRGELVVKRRITKNLQQQFAAVRALPQGHDVVLWYSGSPEVRFQAAQAQLDTRPEGYWHHFWSNADRHTMRYLLLGVTPRTGQWKWARERALKAVENYRLYERKAKGRSLVQYWRDTGCSLEFIRLSVRGKVENWFPPAETRIADTIWTDIHAYENEKLYPTQKHTDLLERLFTMVPKPNALVLDCFAGGGTAAVAAEKLGRRWIICDNSKFAVHISRKRLISMSARPFTVENVGFYQRGEAWQDAWGRRPAARVYRNAILELFGAEPLDENSGFVHLHGRKGRAYVHVGPLNRPLTEAQSDAVAQEAAENGIKQVVLLSADYAAMFDLRGIEQRHKVKIEWRIIPLAAIEAVRDRLAKRRAGKEPAEPDPIHFFVPPVIGLRPRVEKRKVRITLTSLEVALSDCLMTQDPKKRAEIAKAITHWTSLVDYWAVDWNYDGRIFRNDWQAFRTKKNRELVTTAENQYTGGKGERTIAVKVTDIFGNDGLRVFKVTL
jgi:adenine-specific DNA-methyltransferase